MVEGRGGLRIEEDRGSGTDEDRGFRMLEGACGPMLRGSSLFGVIPQTVRACYGNDILRGSDG
eukprot:5876803-Pyramimonas_sp.AAC.1